MANIKVYNKTAHNVGIKLTNGLERTVPPNGLTLLNMDEIEALATSTKLFTEKHLVLEDEKVLEMIGLNKSEISADTDEEILSKLSGYNMPKLTAYLNSIKEKHLQFKVITIAKDNMNKLPASKINKINEVFNVDLNVVT